MLYIIVTGVNSESEYTFSKLYLQQDLGLSLKIYKKTIPELSVWIMLKSIWIWSSGPI